MRFVETMQTMLGDARRVITGGGALASVLLASAGMAMAQITPPRYQSPIEAPVPQVVLPTTTAITPNATVVEDVVVRVNDQIVDRSDVQREEQSLADAARQGKVSPAEYEEAQRDMLRDMIDTQLLLSRGKELDLNVDAEVVRQLDEIRKQNHLDAMEEKDCIGNATCTSLEKAVRESGISYEDFRADMKNKMIRQEVLRDEVGHTLHRPSTAEEQAYYDQHKAEFEQPEQVRLSEILIPTPEGATDAQIAQAQAKADEVAAKLKTGAAFEDLAKQTSGGQSADKGGDLGLFKRGSLPGLEDKVFPLKAGESTPPIRTRQGFVVLKVTEHMAAGAPPLKEVQDQVEEGLYNEQMQPAMRKYLTGLRERAYIDIAPGFVDSSASPKETKLVYSSSTAPAPKKKKSAAQKSRLVSTRTVPSGSAAAPAGGQPAPAGAEPPAAGASAAGAAGVSSASASGAPAAKTVNVATGKKPKKIRREKVRFGQAPRNSLPSGPEETLAAGADQGAGATSNVLGAGAPIAPLATNVASNADPLAPQPLERRKTRYSDRAETEAATKAAAKAAKVAKIQQKAAESPAVAMTPEEKAALQAQNAPLGLGGDTASKKKKKKVKGAPKERLQDQPPAPASAKPEMTPIPPKSVRDNGEPVVAPPANPPATPGAPSDAPANPAPAPPPT